MASPPFHTSLYQQNWLHNFLPEFRKADPKGRDRMQASIQQDFLKHFKVPADLATACKDVSNKVTQTRCSLTIYQAVTDFIYRYGRKRHHRNVKQWSRKTSFRDVVGYYKKQEVKAVWNKKINTYQSALNVIMDALTPEEREAYKLTHADWLATAPPPEKQQE